MTIRLCLLVVLTLIGVAAAPSAAASAEPVLDPPVRGEVLDRFHVPTPYGAGHRGVDLAASLGTAVRASAAGRVTFAGRVVDAIWVTVDHGSIRTTVGPLSDLEADRGDRVVRGSILGRSGRAHGRLAVHWSARRGDRYVDPLLVGRVRASLVDTSTTPPDRYDRATSAVDASLRATSGRREVPRPVSIVPVARVR